jgi:hypothetical protein
MRDAIFNDGTMSPVNFIGSPGKMMSHTYVDQIVVASVNLILSGFVATHLLSTFASSMMKMAVVPVSAIASFAAMVSAFKYGGMGLPNIAWAVAASNGRFVLHGEQLDIMAVASLSSLFTVCPAVVKRVGSRERFIAETK